MKFTVDPKKLAAVVALNNNFTIPMDAGEATSPRQFVHLSVEDNTLVLTSQSAHGANRNFLELTEDAEEGIAVVRGMDLSKLLNEFAGADLVDVTLNKKTKFLNIVAGGSTASKTKVSMATARIPSFSEDPFAKMPQGIKVRVPGADLEQVLEVGSSCRSMTSEYRTVLNEFYLRIEADTLKVFSFDKSNAVWTTVGCELADPAGDDAPVDVLLPALMVARHITKAIGAADHVDVLADAGRAIYLEMAGDGYRSLLRIQTAPMDPASYPVSKVYSAITKALENVQPIELDRVQFVALLDACLRIAEMGGSSFDIPTARIVIDPDTRTLTVRSSDESEDISAAYEAEMPITGWGGDRLVAGLRWKQVKHLFTKCYTDDVVRAVAVHANGKCQGLFLHNEKWSPGDEIPLDYGILAPMVGAKYER